MSDPLSVTASVIAVLQLSTTAIQYLKDVKHGSADRVRLRDELRNTVCLLEMLKDHIEDSTVEPASIKSLGGPGAPLDLFKRVLEDVIAKLAPQDLLRRLSKALTWPFDKAEISEMLATLERLKSHVSLVMQNDLVELAKKSNLKLHDIDHTLRDSAARSHDDEVQRIISWVSTVSFRARHVDVLDSVQPGTGRWLLDHETFRSWVKGDTNILWCPGIPGAGKTRLASLIIDHLEQENSSPNRVATFIYCDYHQRNQQTSAALLSNLLQQLLQKSVVDTLSSELVSLYNLHKKYSTRPTMVQITDILRRLIAGLETFHVVIDALDECTESEQDALQFASAVCSLGPQTKVLYTSRFSTAFESYFDGSKKLEIAAKSQDISMFLESQLQHQYRLSKHIRSDPKLKEDIIQTIVDESQGMFLLAKLHVESLSQKINRKEVRKSLQTLPATLNATYADALQRVYSQAPDTVNLAESILFWVICSRRPMTVLELQQMYAIRELPEEVALEEDDLPDGDILTGACGGLIIVDGESNTVRAVHYTAQQYFERDHGPKLSCARLSLTNISLTYLVLPNFSNGICTTDAAMSQRLENYPFLDYAARHWGSEAYDLSEDLTSQNLQRFVSNPVAVSVANQVWSFHEGRYTNWSQEFPRDVPALVLASAFDIPRILQELVRDGHNIEGKGSDGETALIRSAASGYTENIRVLLELGAAVNARDHMDETSLQRAARIGNFDVVKVLLHGAADVSLKASNDWTPLMSAVSSGNIEVVRLLVEAGADLASETVWGDSALSMATRNGQEAIATFLADNGATLPRNPAGRRASTVASRKGFQQLIRRLTLDYEAIAGRPLERQSSGIMGGLAGIQEVSEPAEEGESAEAIQVLRSGHGDDDFLDVMEGLEYTAGFPKRYDLGQKIGKGNFAEVFTCSNRVTGLVYAVKVFTVQKWTRSTALIDGLRLGEYQMMEETRQNPHPNILRLIGIFAEYVQSKIYVVMELATEGELFDLIVAKQKFTDEETRELFAQVFSALEFLHDRGWVHRDIKPENILMTGKDPLSIKVADFGLAKKITGEIGDPVFLTTLCGTPSYVAPEILAETRTRKYGFAVDIWSAGVVLYICLCGFPPFSDELYSPEYPYTLSQQIKEGRFDYPSPYWDAVGDPALDFIDSLLVVDPLRRLTVRECIKHPWMANSSVPIVSDMVRSESPDPIDELRRTVMLS